MAEYSIKDLERLSGIKAHTIRIWEQRYGILKPERTDTNIRRYDDKEVKLLLIISQLLKHGGKISKLAGMSHNQLAQELEAISQQPASTEQYYSIHIDKLVVAMIELNEPMFEKIIATTMLKYGFENTMKHIVMPFLSKIGFMWQTGEINVAQEHFISNLIRRKIIVAIDGLMLPPDNAERYILFLPENELHEIGLLYAKYMLKMSGKRILYLGQAIPMHDLVEAAKVFKPNVLLTYLTSQVSKDTMQDLVNVLHINFPKQKILIGGGQVEFHALRSYMNILTVRTPEELANFINPPVAVI